MGSTWERAGLPAGATLEPSGPLTISDPGTVVSGRDVRGALVITADDVTVRRTRVTGSAFAVISIKQGVRGARIEDVEVDGLGLQGQEGSTGIEGPATVTRTRVTGVENGIKPGDGSVIENSVIRGLLAPGTDPHYDGVEINGGADIVVRENLVDLHEWAQTSCVMIDNYSSPATRITVAGNNLLGGGYTVYSDGRFDGGPITEVSVLNNRLGKGYWGYAAVESSTPTWSGNIDVITAEPVVR